MATPACQSVCSSDSGRGGWFKLFLRSPAQLLVCVLERERVCVLESACVGVCVGVRVCMLPQSWCCTAWRAAVTCCSSGPARSRPASVAPSPGSEPRGWTSETCELEQTEHNRNIPQDRRFTHRRHPSQRKTVLRAPTPLGGRADVLVQLLGLRRGDLRVGQLGVDVVGDGLHGRPRAVVGDQVAGRELEERRRDVKDERLDCDVRDLH